MINESRIVNEFSKLVSIDSPTLGEKEVGEYIKQALLDLGFEVQEDNAGEKLKGNCGNIYGFLEGNNKMEPLLFSAHMDTVEPSSNKRVIIHDDGKITSGGDTILGADDICGIVGILEALRSIKEENINCRPIEVLFTVAEETYCDGAKVFDFTSVLSKEAYVLDITGDIGTAVYKAPSILSFEVEVRGKASHAGFEPHKGIHAIKVAADAISKLSLGNVNENTTLNIGIISGGVATNIVPDSCVINGEIRSYSHQDALKLLEDVKSEFKKCGNTYGAEIRFETKIGCKAYETPKNHEVIKRLKDACESLNLPFALDQSFGGSDNNIFADNHIFGVVLACGMHNCHSCNEYTTTNELIRIAELTKALMTSNY